MKEARLGKPEDEYDYSKDEYEYRDETNADIWNMTGFRIGGPKTMDGRID